MQNFDDTKIYGSSVIDINDNENTLNPFNDIHKAEYEYIDDYDKNIKNTKVVEINTIDPTTGIRSSVQENAVNNADISDDDIEYVEKLNIKNKSLSRTGKELIKNLINRYPTDEEMKILMDYFSEKDDIESIKSESVEKIENVLPIEVIDKIKSVTNDNNYKSVLYRFISRIYETYAATVEYADDMAELLRLSRSIKEQSKSDDINEEKESSDNLSNISDQIDNFVSYYKNMNLDERNKKLKQNYSIDDVDILVIDSIAECLSNALAFKSVYDKLENTLPIIKKNINKISDINDSIEKWIDSIRTDPETLYTFPVNDHLPLKESREEMENYFYNTYLGNYISTIVQPLDSYLDEDGNPIDVEKYLIDTNQGDTKLFELFHKKAKIVLYLISRTFKIKKLVDVNNRRILSYTLDIISKLDNKDYRDRFIKLSNDIYNKIYNN